MGQRVDRGKPDLEKYPCIRSDTNGSYAKRGLLWYKTQRDCFGTVGYLQELRFFWCNSGSNLCNYFPV